MTIKRFQNYYMGETIAWMAIEYISDENIKYKQITYTRIH